MACCQAHGQRKRWCVSECFLFIFFHATFLGLQKMNSATPSIYKWALTVEFLQKCKYLCFDWAVLVICVARCRAASPVHSGIVDISEVSLEKIIRRIEMFFSRLSGWLVFVFKTDDLPTSCREVSWTIEFTKWGKTMFHKCQYWID